MAPPVFRPRNKSTQPPRASRSLMRMTKAKAGRRNKLKKNLQIQLLMHMMDILKEMQEKEDSMWSTNAVICYIKKQPNLIATLERTARVGCTVQHIGRRVLGTVLRCGVELATMVLMEWLWPHTPPNTDEYPFEEATMALACINLAFPSYPGYPFASF